MISYQDLRFRTRLNLVIETMDSSIFSISVNFWVQTHTNVSITCLIQLMMAYSYNCYDLLVTFIKEHLILCLGDETKAYSAIDSIVRY